MYEYLSFANRISGLSRTFALEKVLFALLGSLVAAGGCSREPFPLIPVTGKVTYADGSLIPGEAIMVRFVPVERKTVGKDVAGAATGYLNPRDGTFPGLTTHKGLDGAVPGRYKVILSCIDLNPKSAASAHAIPRRYQDPQLTPLEVEVSTANRYFELTIEKPG